MGAGYSAIWNFQFRSITLSPLATNINVVKGNNINYGSSSLPLAVSRFDGELNAGKGELRGATVYKG